MVMTRRGEGNVKHTQKYGTPPLLRFHTQKMETNVDGFTTVQYRRFDERTALVFRKLGGVVNKMNNII